MKKLRQKPGAALRTAAKGIALAAITAALAVSGCTVPQALRPASAKAATKAVTIKPDTDFILKVPASWKGNYTVEKSRSKKHGSYVSFSAKKCKKEGGDGCLFTILRYRDDSYADELPEYELVGRWGGMNYVAAFPTEKQTYGVSKAAKKQYSKLVGGAYKAAFSIRPAKKRAAGEGVYRTSDFSLKLPASWKDNYTVLPEANKDGSFASFYAKKCHEETGEGFLFSITGFKDDSYLELPDYELVGKWNGVSYVAIFPTDVQFAGASEEAVKQYQTLEKTARKAARSILR